MRILVVAATDAELAAFDVTVLHGAEICPRMKMLEHRRHDIQLLVTGVGMVATAAWCSKILGQNSYDLVINLGVCGSFDSSRELGQVVHVTSDLIADLGAEDSNNFLSAQNLKLLDENEFPFTGGRLVNSAPPLGTALASLPRVDGITVNTIHGNEPSIAAAIELFHPQVESMEGAAFMYACLIHQVPFAQVRAVSNFVEKRNREAWNLAGAIGNLSEVALRIIEEV